MTRSASLVGRIMGARFSALDSKKEEKNEGGNNSYIITNKKGKISCVISGNKKKILSRKDERKDGSTLQQQGITDVICLLTKSEFQDGNTKERRGRIYAKKKLNENKKNK